MTTDSGPQFTSSEAKDFFDTWGVQHHVTSAYNPHSNMRAETAVKTVNILLMDNTGHEGSLNLDKFMSAMLQHHNTPIQYINLSPSQILSARNMRDRLPVQVKELQMRPAWVSLKQDREAAFRKGHILENEKWPRGTRELLPLVVGSSVLVQNQAGPKKEKRAVSSSLREVLEGNS